MKFVLIVDAACDLPTYVFEKYNIKILHINIDVEGVVFKDDSKDQTALDFYQKELIEKNRDAQSLAPSVSEIYEFFQKEIISKYDYALMMTVSNANSEIFKNAVLASQKAIERSKSVRIKAGKTTKFNMDIINTGTVFAAQGLYCLKAISLLKQKLGKKETIKQLTHFSNNAFGYGVPKDVAYIRERALKKGIDSVSMFGALMSKAFDIHPIICVHNNTNAAVAKVRRRETAIEKMFDYAIECIQNKKLLLPTIVISYAGELDKLVLTRGFVKLSEVAKKHNIEVYRTVSNVTAGLNLGPGAVSMALALEKNELS
ncbi:MAG: DegV family protein [Saccharospirillaceae bacterium]|nr:DegV family protein [Pseudomonadales bacterium]NRB78340.1 DegV family protein [Saccharospirillaceae bacterium]